MNLGHKAQLLLLALMGDDFDGHRGRAMQQPFVDLQSLSILFARCHMGCKRIASQKESHVHLSMERELIHATSLCRPAIAFTLFARCHAGQQEDCKDHQTESQVHLLSLAQSDAYSYKT